MTQLGSFISMLDCIKAPYEIVNDDIVGDMEYDTKVVVNNSHDVGYNGFVSHWYFLDGGLVMVAHWE